MFFRRKKTGHIYRVQMIVTNEADLKPAVVYSDAETGMIWSRPASEFFDGRFEVYVPSPQAPGEGMLH